MSDAATRIDHAAKRLAGPAIRLHPRDNVVVARLPIAAGTLIAEEGITARDAVTPGHKLATRDIRAGEEIRKFNVIIGFAARDLPAGSALSGPDVAFREFDRDYAHAVDFRPVDYVPEAERARFMGIVRPNGQVATRNYIGILSTVNCSATVVNGIADHFRNGALDAFANVDGVVALAHQLGCGMELSGEPMALLRRTLGGYARHPNLAAVLIVGLGCERNQIGALLEDQKLGTGPKLRSFTMQEVGGTRRTIEAGIAAVKELLPEVNDVRRESVPASHITVGLQCGGSDSFSSITANPALGHAMDILVRHGGTAILSETPEIYGVEHTLTRRAASVAVGEKLIERIRWWKDVYAAGRDTQINGIVSPGNQMGGLANIFEKSLGSSMKGGTGPLMEVYRYAEPVTSKGFVFMDSPGYDPVSATGQVAGGANVIAFTTGRGSMFGCKPVPSVKLATNTPMFQRLEEDMDINCGEILDGTASLEEMGRRIFELILRTASGEKSKSELLGVGGYEFVPWQIGIMG